MEGAGSAGNLPGKSLSQAAAFSLTDMQTEAAASSLTNTPEEALSTNKQPTPLLINAQSGLSAIDTHPAVALSTKVHPIV